MSRSITSMKLSNIYTMGDNPFVDVLSNDGTESAMNLEVDYGNIKYRHNCVMNTIGWRADRNFNIVAYLGQERKVDLSTIPYLTHIGKNAFFANLLEEIWLPDTLQVIDIDAFRWCFELRKIHTPEGTRQKFLILLPKHLWGKIKEAPSDEFGADANNVVDSDDDLPF